MPLITLTVNFQTDKKANSLNKAIGKLFTDKKPISLDKLFKILAPVEQSFTGIQFYGEHKPQEVAVFGLPLQYMPHDTKITLTVQGVGPEKKRLGKKLAKYIGKPITAKNKGKIAKTAIKALSKKKK